MWLRKETGGSAVGPHEWEHDGDVTEVPDRLGNELLGLGGYSAAEAPKVPEPPAPLKAAPPAPLKAATPEPVKAEPGKVKPAAKHGKPDLGDS